MMARSKRPRQGLSLQRLLWLAVILAACLPASMAAAQGQGISVVASFYPLEEVVRWVGGDRVDVTNILAVGAEPHDVELTPREIDRLRNARLLVYLGAGFQPSLERALEARVASNLLTLDVVQGMSLMRSSEHDAHAEKPPPGRGDQEPRDPHVWLDPSLMKEIVGRVRTALIRIDPAGQEVYEANAHDYLGLLDELADEYQAGLANCRLREIVTSHAAFGYLARRFGLQQVAISGISPEADPSPRRLQEIVRFAREHRVRVIYFETLVDPRVAETIAREVGAQTMVLNPIEGLTASERADGKTYVDLMRDNLANLRVGLDCA